MTDTNLALTMSLTALAMILCPLLVTVGMGQLGEAGRTRVPFQIACGAIGSLWGLSTESVMDGTGEWPLGLALAVWGAALIAAAACDAVTQRVPTSLVRTAFVVTGAGIAIALLLQGDLRDLAVTVLAAAAAALTLLACCRFAGAGFGDVRLAALGGLGLGQARASGLLLGLAAVGVVVLGQAAFVMSRGGDRKTLMPLGPALAIGFLIAATA